MMVKLSPLVNRHQTAPSPKKPRYRRSRIQMNEPEHQVAIHEPER